MGEGIGLYKKEKIYHDDRWFLLEYWLVVSGTIKVSISNYLEEEHNGTWVQGLFLREFKLEDHKDYDDLYIHASNFIKKIKEVDAYFNGCIKEHPMEPKRRFIEKDNVQPVRMPYKSAITPDYIALLLLSNGIDFEVVRDIRIKLIEQKNSKELIIP